MIFLKMMAIAILTFITTSVTAQLRTDSIKVYGECGMCKNRIQKTLKIVGISKADWNAENKMLVVIYDASRISNDGIQREIVSVGHDTEKYIADDKLLRNYPAAAIMIEKKLIIKVII